MSPSTPREQTVAVAVSGGMDSLLSLLLLREQGLEVLALHGRFLPRTPERDRAEEALARLCGGLGVPLAVLDLVRTFEERVAAPFVADYAAGLTPNPCARCNPLMKFGALLDLARERGAGRLATGHYARLLPDRRGGLRLFRGLDPVKDQSYFLSLVPPGRLALALFPLGDRLKAGVPAELAARGAEPPLPGESQEICFVPGDDYRAFLEARGVPLAGEGPVRLRDGTVLGRHRGLWRHTLGQRRGLGLAWKEPLYVLDKDPGDNALVVGPEGELACAGCAVRDLVCHQPLQEWPGEVLAQTRYRQKAAPARWEPEGDGLVLRFTQPRTRPAPGQVAAVYTPQGEVLAGGIIHRILPV